MSRLQTFIKCIVRYWLSLNKEAGVLEARPLTASSCFSIEYSHIWNCPAAFLAVRTLHQLAEENQNALPKEAEIIRRDFYVDDLPTGKLASSYKNASDILIQGCFEVRKWVSNHPGALAQLGAHEQAKTLGLVWSSHDDTLLYKTTVTPIPPHITNRMILSHIAQI
nr:unnamed protein product [Callosobruchus analis]